MQQHESFQTIRGGLRLKKEGLSVDKKSFRKQLQKNGFPYYKTIRFVWSVLFTTLVLTFISYTLMEYYFPLNENSLSIGDYFYMVAFVGILTGVGETLYESISSQFNVNKWLINPWTVFMIPSLLDSAWKTPLLFENPEQYQNGLWLDLYAAPIGAFIYLIFRYLFNLIFSRFKKER